MIPIMPFGLRSWKLNPGSRVTGILSSRDRPDSHVLIKISRM